MDRAPVIHLVHGFNIVDGGVRSIAKLESLLEAKGVSVQVFDYGWVGLVGVWFLNDYVAERLMARSIPGDSVAGHSNGCTIIWRAATNGAFYQHAFLFAPALNRSLPFPPEMALTNVIHSYDDWPVRGAAWLRALAPFAPLGDILWGDMGAFGHNGRRTAAEVWKLLDEILARLEDICVRRPLVLNILRVSVGVPMASAYMLCLAPVEVIRMLYTNNLRRPGTTLHLRIKEPAHRRYLLVAMVIPCSIWLAIGMAILAA